MLFVVVGMAVAGYVKLSSETETAPAVSMIGMPALAQTVGRRDNIPHIAHISGGTLDAAGSVNMSFFLSLSPPKTQSW